MANVVNIVFFFSLCFEQNKMEVRTLQIVSNFS